MITGSRWKNISRINKATILHYQKYRLVLQKSMETVENESCTLIKLAKFIDKKPLDKVTEHDLQSFFSDIKNLNTRDLNATHIIMFYRWHLKLDKKQRPENMKWFNYQTKQQRNKNRDPNAKKKYFVTRKEYDDLIQKSINSQDKAIWETLYLTGVRVGEFVSMRICDVTETSGGVEITVTKSKTKPRTIPCPEYPEHLMRWLRNHPSKDNPEAALWVTGKHNVKPIQENGIRFKLREAKKMGVIKKTITPHCFRKTRATLWFEKLDDKEMSDLMGWELETVSQRRREYDLRGYSELRKKIFGDVKRPPSYDVLKEQKEHLEHDFEQRLKSIEQKFEEKMKILDSGMSKASRRYDVSSQKIVEDYQRLKMGLELILNKMVVEGRSQSEIDEFRKLMTHGLA